MLFDLALDTYSLFKDWHRKWKRYWEGEDVFLFSVKE